MRTCQGCGKQYEGNFCPYCGAEWSEEAASERTCPDCGTAVAAGMRFCSNCGYDFSKKKSSEKHVKEKRTEAAEARAASFMEALPALLSIASSALALVFAALAWVFYALPVTSILGENLGNLYQFANGTTELGKLLPPMEEIRWAFLIAGAAAVYALVSLLLVILVRNTKCAHIKAAIVNAIHPVFYVLFFAVGYVIRSKVTDFGLSAGACATTLMICAPIFLVLSVGVTLLAYFLGKAAQAPLNPEEQAETDAEKAKIFKICTGVGASAVALGAVVLAVAVGVRFHNDIFRAGKVNDIVIGASKDEVEEILGTPYRTSQEAEYTQAGSDTVWKYYSKNYTDLYGSLFGDMAGLSAIFGDPEDMEKLNEKANSLHYKYIEVAFKDGKVVAYYLDKDRCDGETETVNDPIQKATVAPFSYIGCNGGGRGSTRLTVKFRDGSCFNDERFVKVDRWHRVTWTDKKGTHSDSSLDSNSITRSKFGHVVGNWVVAAYPTCMEEGVEHAACAYCGEKCDERPIAVDPTAHSYATAWTSDGESHWHECQNSGCTSVKDKTVHSMNWTVDKEATCEDGAWHCTCTVCKKTVNEVLPAIKEHNAFNGKCTECGTTIYTRDGDYIYFGEYPQSIKASDVTVTSATDSRGYYLGSDGFYYAKMTAKPYSSGYTFSTGATVSSGTVYYFKVEPIRWRILSEKDGTALILCDSIIDNHCYDDNGNNYANSEIRAWLNEQFYKTAFNDLQRELILTTTVDNSVYSTGYSSNSNACEDTNDKIFLLSYRDVTNTAYGFLSSSSAYDTARRMRPSDYTCATGVYMDMSGSYYRYSWWWLRSPVRYSYGGTYARGVSSDGGVEYSSSVDYTNCGIVPALQIRFE